MAALYLLLGHAISYQDGNFSLFLSFLIELFYFYTEIPLSFWGNGKYYHLCRKSG